MTGIGLVFLVLAAGVVLVAWMWPDDNEEEK